jgi:hypothetical protein
VTDLLLTAALLWVVIVVLALLELDWRPATWCSQCHRVAIRVPHDCTRQTLRASADRLAFMPEAVQLTARANTETRTISGLVIPWEEYGDTSVGRVIAGNGSIRIPDDLTRVKLVDQHQAPPRVIGYGTQAQVTAEGISMSFHVPETPEGDRALMEASAHLSDAFSVELSQLQLQGDRITDSLLTAVALLGVPAFANARVASVTAANNPQPTQEGTTMTEEQRARLRELLAMNARTPEQEQEYQQLVALAAADTQTPAQPADSQPAAAAGVTDLAAAMLPQVMAAMQQAMTQAGPGDPRLQAAMATTPAGLSGTGLPAQRPLSDLYAATARVFQGQSKPDMEAALSNITQGSNPYVTQDEYAGQLWQALDYTRRFTSLLKSGDLKSYKGNGWKWGVAPAVAAYAGDKAPVPSNSPTTVNVPWTASRLAGAHDIDRKYRDFGDEEFFQAYYEAMTLSYAILSDQAARDFIIASATAGAAVTGGLLTSVAKVVARLNVAINDAGADYVLVNDQDKIGLLSVTAASVPAFLEDFVGIKPGQFIGTSAVPAGTIIAGNRNAGQFKELSGVPIRAEVVDMVNGGVDGGVFGYYATILNMPTAIQKAAWT